MKKIDDGKKKRVRCSVPRSAFKNPCEAKTKQGKLCNSRTVQKYDDRWLCVAHARSMGLREDDARWKERVSIGVSKRKKIRQELLAKFDEESKRDFFLGLDTKAFDAALDYPKIRELNPMPFTEYGSEKYTVGLWMMASQVTRQPQNLAELADLLGFSVNVLETWLRSNEMLDIFDDASTRRMRAKRGLMDAILVNNCVNNQRWALELYYRKYVDDHAPVGAPKQEPRFESEHTLTVKETIREKEEVPRLKSKAARALLQKLKESNPELPSGTAREWQKKEDGIAEAYSGGPGPHGVLTDIHEVPALTLGDRLTKANKELIHHIMEKPEPVDEMTAAEHMDEIDKIVEEGEDGCPTD